MARFVDPFSGLDSMLGYFGDQWQRGALTPMDAYEKDGVYTLRFDLAGADPDKVDVTVEGGVLTVKSERPIEETEGVNWLVRERATGTHSRQIRLGAMLDASNVEAHYDQGVLTITIPTRPEARPQKVSVSTDSRQAISA